MDLDHELRANRRRILMAVCVVASVATAAILATELATHDDSASVAIRLGMLVLTTVVGTALWRRWMSVETAEWLLMSVVGLSAVMDLGGQIMTVDGGQTLAWLVAWNAYTVLLVLATYVVWDRRGARVVAVVWLAFAFGLLGVAAGRLPIQDVVPTSVAVPLLALVLAEAASGRVAVLARHETRARAEAEAGRRDVLSGLPNRRGTIPALEAVTQGDAVLLLDIDRFKQVNDQHGHDVGDVVLRQVAEVLRRACRAEDVVGRWGGEEFLIVADQSARHPPSDGSLVDEPGHDLAITVIEDESRPAASLDVSTAIDLAERLRAAVARIAEPVPVTISVGLAFVGPACDWQETLRRADACLYAAKESGRDRVVHEPGVGSPPTSHASRQAGDDHPARPDGT